MSILVHRRSQHFTLNTSVPTSYIVMPTIVVRHSTMGHLDFILPNLQQKIIFTIRVSHSGKATRTSIKHYKDMRESLYYLALIHHFAI